MRALCALSLLLPLWVSAQQTEFSYSAASGWFRFHGPGSAGTTTINPVPSAENDYGQNSAFSYTLKLQVERVTKGGWLYGLSAGFEILTSQAKVDTILRYDQVNQDFYPAPTQGTDRLHYTYGTFRPFVGHRWTGSGWWLDVDAGLDIAIGIRGRVTINGPYDGEWGTPKPLSDLRPHLETVVGYKCFGVFLGYALGLSNLQTQGGGAAVYSGFLETGICFTFPYPTAPSSRSYKK